MSGPVQKSQYPSQERAVIGGAAPQKSLILTENGPFPQNFGAVKFPQIFCQNARYRKEGLEAPHADELTASQKGKIEKLAKSYVEVLRKTL